MTYVSDRVDEIYEMGFTVITGAYSSNELRDMNSRLDAYVATLGVTIDGGFGVPIHPGLEKVPTLIPYFVKPIMVEVVGAALRDDVRLTHTGSRVSRVVQGDPDRKLSMEWHDHYAWPAHHVAGRAKIERLLGGVYLDGSSPEVGSLVALPRAFNDPHGDPPGPRMSDWPGQVEVEAPPGSIVIFDTCLWHTAKSGSGDGTRHIFGAHWQGWSNSRTHPEDNVVPGGLLEDYAKSDDALRPLLFFSS